MRTPKENVLKYYPGAFTHSASSSKCGAYIAILIPTQHAGNLLIGAGKTARQAWKDAADSPTIKARKKKRK